jgi:hypothetical protein
VTTPYASIIIPVAPAHAHLVATAIASCRWQTVHDWEVIVVNDTGQPLRSVGDDRITVIDAPETTGKRRAAVARNAGIAAARGVFSIFLDADDYLLPSALETFTRGHAGHDKAYSYSHHYGLNRDGAWAQYRPPEYNREPRGSPMSHSTGGAVPVPTMQGCNLHPITAFVPTWCLHAVGGFDEDAPGFEDWTIWLRLAMAGFCGQRIFGPTFVYRRELGISSRPDAHGGQALMDAVTAPYRNKQGDIDMGGCGCGGGADTAKKMAQTLAATFGENTTMDNGNVMLEYIGPGMGRQTFQHPISKAQYRAGGMPATKYIVVPPEDVDYLVHELRMFKRQAPPAPFVPPPQEVGAEPEAAPIKMSAKREKVPA